MTEQCHRCRFWLLDETTHKGPIEAGDIAFGSCRRNAPIVIGELAALGVPRQIWGRDLDQDEELSATQVYRASPQPVTEACDWCGEFSPLKSVDPHLKWLNEYERVRTRANDPALNDDDPIYDALCSRINELEAIVLATPSSTQGGAIAKIFMVAQVTADGAHPHSDQAAQAVVEARQAGIICSERER